MGWERRKGRRYYYRKQRVGRRVVSRYMGTGREAEETALQAMLQAELARRRLEERRRESALRDAQREEERRIDEQVEELYDLANAVAAGALTLSGHYRHKGQWRKRVR